jgi:fructose-1,6-bisphosphatase/inositol monophosphatase family enzyme
MGMSRIFIAYASADVQRALRLHHALQKRGYPAWLDLNDVPLPRDDGRSPFSGLVNEVIESCDRLIVVNSKRASESQGVRTELRAFVVQPGMRRIFVCTTDGASTDWLTPHAFTEVPLDLEATDIDVGELVDKLGAPSQVSPTDGERLIFAIKLALQAGTTAMRYFGSAFVENRAADERANCATLADHAAHHEIWRMHQNDQRFCDEPLISEEGDRSLDSARAEPFAWIVDPLDGTTNFRMGIPFFCSAVGVLRNGKAYLGVVFDPLENRLYFAQQHRGAFVWNVGQGDLRKLERRRSTGPSGLKSCVAGTHVSTRPEQRARLFKDNILAKATDKVGSIRVLGSGQLALAHVAAGKLDLFFQLGVAAWDIAPGAVIVRNAILDGGDGRVLDWGTGQNWELGERDVIVGPDALVGEFLSSVGLMR